MRLHEGKSQVLSSNKIGKRRKLIQMGLGTGKHINTLMKDRLPEGILRKVEQISLP